MPHLPERIQKAFDSDDPCELNSIIQEKRQEDFISIRSLIDPQTNVDTDLRGKALYAVGRWGDSSCVKDIVSLLPKLDENTLISAIDALGRLGTDEALDAVTSYSKHESLQVRKFVVRAAERFPGEGARRAIERIGSDDESDVIKSLVKKVLQKKQ